MGAIRAAFRRFERSVLRRMMRAGAKIADRRVAKEVDQRRGTAGKD